MLSSRLFELIIKFTRFLIFSESENSFFFAASLHQAQKICLASWMVDNNSEAKDQFVIALLKLFSFLFKESPSSSPLLMLRARRGREVRIYHQQPDCHLNPICVEFFIALQQPRALITSPTSWSARVEGAVCRTRHELHRVNWALCSPHRKKNKFRRKQFPRTRRVWVFSVKRYFLYAGGFFLWFCTLRTYISFTKRIADVIQE